MGMNLGQSIDRAFRGVQARKSSRKAFRGAMAQAYTSCGRHYHPKWASHLLDKEFQALGESRLQDCYQPGIARMGPAELARFWADQIRGISQDVKVRHVAELIPVAERFLQLLTLELCERQESVPC